MKKYFEKFDTKYSTLEKIDSSFYEKELGVKAFCSTAKTKDAQGQPSEEYIRARFVFAMIQSGDYQKEYICVEFGFPKGNGGKSLNPDIAVFKTKDWIILWDEAKKTKSFSKIRQNVLVFFETKKNNKTVDDAIENQLRSAMNENESPERIFGVYFDNEEGILIFKKLGNSPIKRFDETKEGDFGDLNIGQRDLIANLPTQKDFEENNESISRPNKLTLNSLDSIDESNFTEVLNSLKRANDRIHPKTDVHTLIVEFLTLKIFDEKRSQKDGVYTKFYYDTLEDKQKFRERIQQLYKDAKNSYTKVLSRPFFGYDSMVRPSDAGDESFLIELVKEFQQRSILKTKNESFNQIIFNNFAEGKQKADKGQFFTPIPVVNAIVKMLNPQKNETFCDPACGIADFIAMAFRHMHREEIQSKAFYENAENFFGFDLEASNLKLAELNLVLNGDGGAVLHQMDSLAQKYLDNGNVLEEGKFVTQNFAIDWENRNDATKNPKKYKIIATNPPFGKGRDLKTGKSGKWDLPKDTMHLYETWEAKPTPDKKGKIKLPGSMDMGVLFLENSYKLLEDGGRMGIVLSNSIASIKEWENIRKWLIERMRIVALFDLPANTFGETGVSTTIIIAYKPKQSEKKLLSEDYEVFIREIENLGYEVKTKKKVVHFQPQFVIDEETFEKTGKKLEDFSQMQKDFSEFMKRQEEEIKKAFHSESLTDK